jgi:NADH dehydrogenase
VLAEVSAVDLGRRAVVVGGRPIPFDKLIIATGARHAYFGHDEWEAHALGLKRIDDAIALHSQILLAFEKAETEEDDEERRRLLTFVIVDAGATGVEMAGAIADLTPKALAAEFRKIDPRKARIVLIEASPRLLPSFSAPSSSAAARALEKLGSKFGSTAA